MKKIINILLSALLFATSFATMTSCNISEEIVNGKEMQRYVYEDGIHDYTAPEMNNEYLVKNGTTEYVLVVPADASSRVELAADEFRVLFKRATNIEIPSVLDNSGDPILQDENAKRISIGETSLIKEMRAEERKGRDVQTSCACCLPRKWVLGDGLAGQMQ